MDLNLPRSQQTTSRRIRRRDCSRSPHYIPNSLALADERADEIVQMSSVTIFVPQIDPTISWTRSQGGSALRRPIFLHPH